MNSNQDFNNPIPFDEDFSNFKEFSKNSISARQATPSSNFKK